MLPATPLVLVTRPRLQAQSLVQACLAAGWRAQAFSPIRIEPNPAGLAQLPQAWAWADAVFFVSPSAIDVVAASGLDWTGCSGSLICVGAGSAKRLQLYSGREVWFPDEGHDSEAVLAMPFWQRQRPQRVLIVRGQAGRTVLETELRAQGVDVQCLSVYFRQPEPLDWSVLASAMEHSAPVAVCVTSVSIAQAWFAQLPSALHQAAQRLLYLSIHPRISAELHRLGACKVVTCAAGDDALLAGLHQELDPPYE